MTRTAPSSGPVGFRVLAAVVGLVAALAGVFATTLAAHADTWGDSENNQISGVGAHPDAGEHSWCLLGIAVDTDDDWYNSIRHAMTQSIGADTDAVNDFKSVCDGSGEFRTDVAWREGFISSSTRGTTSCTHWAPASGNCDQNLVIMNFQVIAEGSNDYEDMQKTACHEGGHTVGLQHHGDRISSWGCMINGEIPSTSSTWRYFGAHHVDHVNDWF